MEICRSCHKEISDASVTTCDGNALIQYPNGQALQRILYNPKALHLPAWFRCPDCNIAPGGTHHFNCDQEECPKCGGQLISCDCFDAGSEQEAK